MGVNIKDTNTANWYYNTEKVTTANITTTVIPDSMQ